MTRILEQARPVRGLVTGVNALIALAHPDDEFLIGGLLWLLRSRDVTTHAVIATDGEASDRGDPAQLHNRGRRLEASAALGKYGIDQENQHFLGLPDGALANPEAQATLAVAVGKLLADQAIHTIITLGDHGFDNHADHRAAHDATLSAAKAYATTDPTLQLYGLTNNETAFQVPADPGMKLRRLAPHRTQFEVDLSDPSYLPAADTVEQLGVRLSVASRAYLAPYFLNMQLERYENYELRD